MAATASTKSSHHDTKQGRLPFKVLDIKTALQCPNTPQLKRKHSGSDDGKTAKNAKCETVKSKTANIENIVDDVVFISPENVPLADSKSTSFSVKEDQDDLERIKIVEDVLRTSVIEVIDPVVKPLIESKEKDTVSSLNSTLNSCSVDSSMCSSSDLNSSLDHKSIIVVSDSGVNNEDLPQKTNEENGKRKIRRNKEDKEKKKAARERFRQEKGKKMAEAKEEKRRLSEAARLKRLQEKEEEKQKRLQEKEDAKQKILMKKEQERKEREEKLQEKIKAKEKEKEEKLKQLEEKRQLMSFKQEEKKRKEEQKQKKLEDKKKSEEEEERKKNKVKAAFASFFIKNESNVQTQEHAHGLFKPFEVKKDMMLASVIPDNVTFDPNLLESYLLSQDCHKLYIDELQTKSHTPHKTLSNKTKNEVNCDDVILVEDNENNRMKAKLFYFCENIRPPYRGTWRKRSFTVKPRNPFLKDSMFDYDVDSDEEWEEGGPGESLSGTEEEKESEDDYEVDNEFFVPHGYLSADEEKDEDGEMADSPEMQKVRLKIREKEFEDELKRKCSQLKPCVLGCIWSKESNEELYRSLISYQAINMCPLPVVNQVQDASDQNGNNSFNGSPTSDSQKKRVPKTFPEEAIPHLIKLVHANTRGKTVLVTEFTKYWMLESKKTEEATLCVEMDANKENNSKESPSSPNLSKGLVEVTLKKIATYMKNPHHSAKRCWWVHEDIRAKYNLADLPSVNNWQYVSCDGTENTSTQLKTPNQTIMKFAKKITPTRVDSSPSSTPPSGEIAVNTTPKTVIASDTKRKEGKKRTMSILHFAKRLRKEDNEETCVATLQEDLSHKPSHTVTSENTEEMQAVPQVIML